ncbi:hypothetical protein GTP44_06550 [Duganella sp. FT50W]|uniref:Phospho-N-acetylmuramoyl-pentapeptide-transferase n=1 Tax=Duganella lactea TaxID=2692173 RepID=A0A6L8MGG4_9BURK|nr:hypothetical protein [Duganella lactea]MYM81614.1 hypothetical protein [Duganella lactea]
MMIIGEFAFYLFMEVLMYSLGRFVIPVISFGRARAARTREIFSRKPVTTHTDDGKLLVPEWGVAIVGLLTLTAAIALYIALR